MLREVDRVVALGNQLDGAITIDLSLPGLDQGVIQVFPDAFARSIRLKAAP